MSQNHPSPELLNAFFDQELDSPQAAEVTTHLSSCPDCPGVLAEFESLQALGPVVEEMLPAKAYWLDLPDRILARIVVDTPVPVPAAETRSWWDRIVNPTGALRWALGTGAVAVLVTGTWMTLRQPEHPITPVGSDLAENQAAEAPSTDGANLFPSNINASRMDTDTFTRRVVTTLGGNPGTSLDLVPGQPIAGAQPGPGSPVALSLPPLSPESRAETERVVSYGCGDNPLERAFLAAVKAEESGQYQLALQGYQLVRASTDVRHPLYWEAHFRFMSNLWSQKLQSVSPVERARILDDLTQQAQATYRMWARTGRQEHCQEAWCMNRTLLKLAQEAVNSQEYTQSETRMQELLHCSY